MLVDEIQADSKTKTCKLTRSGLNQDRLLTTRRFYQHISFIGDLMNVYIYMMILWSENVIPNLPPHIEKCNACWFLLTWENMTGGVSGILRRWYSIQLLAASPPKEATISIKPPLCEQIFTLLAAALRDEFWRREENMGNKRRRALKSLNFYGKKIHPAGGAKRRRRMMAVLESH